MRVKICGITRPEDALVAQEAGADAIGLIFVETSKRCVNQEQAAKILAAVGPFMARVGVFVNQPLSKVRALAQTLRLTAVQLHGDEDASFVADLKKDIQVIKAVSFSPNIQAKDLASYSADAVLLDGLQPGSGEAFTWSEAQSVRGFPKLILAGGLHPQNVLAGIRALSPYAVDVASGVESHFGVKDPKKIQDFVYQAKTAYKS